MVSRKGAFREIASISLFFLLFNGQAYGGSSENDVQPWSSPDVTETTDGLGGSGLNGLGGSGLHGLGGTGLRTTSSQSGLSAWLDWAKQLFSQSNQ